MFLPHHIRMQRWLVTNTLVEDMGCLSLISITPYRMEVFICFQSVWYNLFIIHSVSCIPHQRVVFYWSRVDIPMGCIKHPLYYMDWVLQWAVYIRIALY